MNKLYGKDFNLWLEEIAIAIKNRDVSKMDWDNLLEEIEDMGASQKRALRSYLNRLIEQIFKLKYWTSERDRNRNNWRLEITNFRREIKSILEDSPSLNKYLAENYLFWYDKSVKGLQKSKVFELPNHQPISLDEVLDDNYFG
ncbi:DUF29 domain-containing protein [Pleurocapsa sp. CCALA 161]|uniref:DUF29 domain-containing protein n=1 Tax=Pleurocapsa sp. CCALA 161 TaxID=2107688 RepID=UPI000D04FF08|nr:DUF29 domain-containing protein [Pleurocapsa sp. CCALA 161]PSB08178.1 DUF29 domain-containing protein [Pleurocapsa sp. CCALA 161]